ncbi:hypothetical protein TNCV_4405601 [Trichonephila clavipes]|uniref:Tc1-like transposase DDE domain-containing protein n=1 Tax=Trichonephila clavipes TaxID=2585209 RepID=A0A8X6S754_TRICX|nr:hypothetical protein TNCV_4405601 [Trichonephila clavipes]
MMKKKLWIYSFKITVQFIKPNWFDEHGIDAPYLTCPANSPNLNVIEKICDMLKSVKKRKYEHQQNLASLKYQFNMK